MKKTIVALVALVGTTLSTFGQGAVVLGNLTGTVDAPISRADGSAPGAAGRAQLYLADSNTPLTPATTFLDVAGFEKYLTQTDVVIAGNNGTPVNLVLKAWIGAAGSNFDTATERGFSNTISVTPGVPPATGADLVGLQAFSMTIIPEPSTIALGILGAAALLLRRRK
jgi:hypothetical protein